MTGQTPRTADGMEIVVGLKVWLDHKTPATVEEISTEHHTHIRYKLTGSGRTAWCGPDWLYAVKPGPWGPSSTMKI